MEDGKNKERKRKRDQQTHKCNESKRRKQEPDEEESLPIITRTPKRLETPRRSRTPKRRQKSNFSQGLFGQTSNFDSSPGILEDSSKLPSSPSPSSLHSSVSKSPASSVGHSSREMNFTRVQSIKLKPDKRFSTLMGSKQGEHVSAYVLYEELILSILQDTNAKGMINSLKEGVSCIASGFDEEQEKKLRESQGKFFEVVGSNVPRKKRQFIADAIKSHCKKNKELAANLGGYEAIKKENDDAVRNSNRANLIEVIEQIVEVVLRASNKMQYVSFPKQGGLATPSRDEKTLKNDLRALNDYLFKLYRHEDVIDHTTKEVVNDAVNSDADFSNTLKRRKVERGYKYAGYSFASQKKQKKQDLVNTIEEVILSIQDRNTFIKEVADKIKLLFWYPMVDDDFLIEPSQWEEEAHKCHYNVGTQFRDNDLETLYYVAARHIVLIFNCYKGLTYLPEEMQEAIVDKFLEYVLDKPSLGKSGDYGQGWCQHPDFKSKNHDDIMGRLKEGINEYASLNYAVGKFRMREQHELEDDTEDDLSMEAENDFSEDGSFSP